MDTYTHVRDAFYSGEHAFTGDKQTVKDISLSEKLRDFLTFWESEKRAEVLKKLSR